MTFYLNTIIVFEVDVHLSVLEANLITLAVWSSNNRDFFYFPLFRISAYFNDMIFLILLII